MLESQQSDPSRLNCEVVSTGELSSGHLQQQHSKTEHVHLGTLLGWVGGLWCCIGRVARPCSGHQSSEVGRAVVRELGHPGSLGGCWVEENVGTAHVSVEDEVRSDQVHVVESQGHVAADCCDLCLSETTSPEDVPEAGAH